MLFSIGDGVYGMAERRGRGWGRRGEDGRGWEGVGEETREEGEGVGGDGWGLPAVFEEVALGA